MILTTIIILFKGNCRQLKTINIMLSPQDCVDNPTNKKDKEKYKKMVKALEVSFSSFLMFNIKIIQGVVTSHIELSGRPCQPGKSFV